MPTRKWGTEILVNTTTLNYQTVSDVATLANGNYIVVWQDDDQSSLAPNSAIRGQLFDALGNKIGGELEIAAPPGNDQVLPSVTGLADGGFYVTWTQLVGGDNYILGSVYDANGNFLRSQTVVYAFGQDSDSDVARLGDGSIVAWQDPDANSGDIDFRIFDANGNGGPVITANTAVTANQAGPSVAVSPDQATVAITWYDVSDSSIEGRLFDATGAQTAPQFRIDAPGGPGHIASADPVVTWLNDSIFVVVWRDFNNYAFGNNEIKARIFDGQSGTANPLTGNISVNSTISESQQHPAITALPNGGFVVAWEDTSGIGPDGDFAIRLQAFDGAGNKTGGEIVVNTTTDGAQFEPSISALPDGRVVVTWTDNSQTGGDTSGTAIRMQIVDPRDGIVTGTPAADKLYGHDFVNDEISGSGGNDVLYGLGGNDALYGGSGSDTLIGGTGGDGLDGGLGRDRADYRDAPVGLTANLQNAANNTGIAAGDTYVSIENLYGSNFADVLNGNAAGNRLWGAGGKDRISGGNGSDTLDGGAGNDTLTGGTGRDILSGGGGVDHFVFKTLADSTADTSRDHITDFVKNSEKIDLSAIDAQQGVAGNQAFHFIGGAAFTGAKGDLRAHNATAGTFVYADVDGDKHADFSLLVENVHNLHSGDFVL